MLRRPLVSFVVASIASHAQCGSDERAEQDPGLSDFVCRGGTLAAALAGLLSLRTLEEMRVVRPSNFRRRRSVVHDDL